MENTQENKSIYDLLRELADIQFNRAKVEAATFTKKGKKLVSSKVNDMRECILESADEYNQKIEFVEGTKTIKNEIEANILRNYELSLSTAKREFEAMHNGIAKEKGNLEIIENTAIMRQDYYGKLLEEEKKKPEYIRGEQLKKQIKDALDNGEDIEKVKVLVEELEITSKAHKVKEYEKEYNENLLTRKRVEEQRIKWDKILDGLQDEERKAIEIVTGKKEELLKASNEKYLTVIAQNQSWLKRAFGKLANIFMANKRYSDNVTKVLSDKVENLSEKIIPDLNEHTKKKAEELRENHEKLIKNFELDEKKYIEDNSQNKLAKDTSGRSAKMYDITREEESKKNIRGTRSKAKEKAEKQKKFNEDNKETVLEKPQEQKKQEEKQEEKIEQTKVEPKEVQKTEKNEKKIEFKTNERINPWKVVGMGKTVGWRGVGKGKKLSIDKKKAGLEKDDGER